MADLRPVQSYINLDAIDAENDAMVSKVKSTVAAILSEFKKTKGIELKLSADPASAKQIRQAIEDLTKTQQKLQKSIQDVNKIREQQIKLELQSEKLATQRKKTLIEETKLNDLNTKSREKSAAAAQKEAAAATKSASAYEQLKQRYKIAANTALELGASQGVLSEDFLQASRQAQKLSKELLTLESSVGRSQRNVGNYASGWSGLSNSINQISRELPSFANSVQTGFLAISNNLPIFFDEIGRAKKEIAALRAEGKETQGLLSRLGSAFFSFGTVLSIGVTLLTIYGKEIGEFFVSIFKGVDALDAFAEKQRVINEAFKDSAVKDAFENVEKVGVAFNLAKQGVISKKEALDVYNETLGDTIGKASSLEEAERLYAANSENYIKATLFRAAAQKALANAADAALAAVEKQNKKATEFSNVTDFAGSLQGFGGTSGLIDTERVKKREEEQAKTLEARRKAEIDAEKRKQQTFEQIAAELFATASGFANKLPNFSLLGKEGDAKKNNDKIKAVNQEFFDDELKTRIDSLKKLSEEEDLFLRTRTDARKEAAALELKRITEGRDIEIANLQATRDAVLKDKESSNIDKLNAENEYNAALQKLTTKSNYELVQLSQELSNDLFSIKLSSIARQRQLDKENADLAVQAFADDTPAKNLEKQNAEMKSALEKRKDFLTADADDQLRRLEEKYQKEYDLVKNNPKKLAKLDEETSLKRKQIQNEANKFILLAELDYANQYLAALKLLGFDVVDQEAKVAELRKKIAENETKTKQDNATKQIAIEEQKAEKLKELAKTGVELISAAVEGTFDQRKNQIQDEIDALDKKKQKDIEVANATIQNEQDRAAAIATINARSQAQKEQLELRQRKVDQDRARFERLKAIADIIQNTAIAITAQTKGLPATAPLIALIGAIGAAQIATVLARPIPKYATGTDDHIGGPAIVGDGGKSELAVTPDGRIIKTPNVPTLMDLPAHTVVLPDANKATEMLAVMAMKRGMLHDRLDKSGGDNGLKAEIIRLQRIIAEKETIQPYMKNGELRTMIRRGQSFVDYINRSV